MYVGSVEIEVRPEEFVAIHIVNLPLVNPPTRLWLGCNNYVTR